MLGEDVNISHVNAQIFVALLNFLAVGLGCVAASPAQTVAAECSP